MPLVYGRKCERKRTVDVETDQECSFSDLLLSAEILEGLKANGLRYPSPIQRQAIPLGLLGSDLLAQAKSGTGKTLVFAIIALELLKRESRDPQVLIVAPTREIAFQIKQVHDAITQSFNPPVRIVCVIGGIPVELDAQSLRQGAQIIVGTPGRVNALLRMELLAPSSIRLVVLDEADKLLEEGLEKQVMEICSLLPERKQVVAVSATFARREKEKVMGLMQHPHQITLSEDTPSLAGVKQYYALMEEDHTTASLAARQYQAFKQKGERLLTLLTQIQFHQCLVFCNQRDLAHKLCRTLDKRGWPTRFISGEHEQQDRQASMEALKQFQLRILVSTDLTARGVDVERVNLVMNMDLPRDPETYFHRIGRTGRYGTYGVAVSFVTPPECQRLRDFQRVYATTMDPLPDVIPPHFYAYQEDMEEHPPSSSPPTKKARYE